MCRPTRTRTGPDESASVSSAAAVKAAGRILEREEERVALRVDLHAVVAGARLANDSPVRC